MSLCKLVDICDYPRPCGLVAKYWCDDCPHRTLSKPNDQEGDVVEKGSWYIQRRLIGEAFCPCQDGDTYHYEGKNPMKPTITLEEARRIVASEDASDPAKALEAVATVLRFNGIADQRLLPSAEALEASARKLGELAKQGEAK